MLQLVGLLFLVGLAHCQYGSSSYSAPAPSSSYGSSSGASSQSAAASLPAVLSLQSAVNFPLLQLPAIVGAATFSSPATAAAASATANGTNYLATLPQSPTASAWGGQQYQYGTYGYYDNDVDPQRQAWYDKSQYYMLDVYTSNLTGYGPMNLSSPNAVGYGQYWGPVAWQLAAWNDIPTTAAATTAAAATVATVATTTNSPLAQSVLASNVYYAANAGNINNIGYAGLGVPVYGPAPVASVSPSLNTYYAVNSAAASPSPSSSSSSASSPSSSSSSSYGSAPMASSSYGGSSSGYGRRRRAVAF